MAGCPANRNRISGASMAETELGLVLAYHCTFISHWHCKHCISRNVNNTIANLLDEGVTYLLVRERTSSPFRRSTHNALLVIMVHILAIWLASAGTGRRLVRAAVRRLAVSGSRWRTLVVVRLRLWRVSCWVRSLRLESRIWSARRSVCWIRCIWGWCYKRGLSTIAYCKDHTHTV